MMNKTKIKKISYFLATFFIAVLLVMTVPAQAAYLSGTYTIVGDKVKVTVTLENAAQDKLDLDAIKAALLVNITLPNGTVVEIDGNSATVEVVSGINVFGYGYQVPDLNWGYGWGYGYGYDGGIERGVSITFTWEVDKQYGTYSVDSELPGAESNSYSFKISKTTTEGYTPSGSGPILSGTVITLPMSTVPNAVELAPGDTVSFTLDGVSHTGKIVSMGSDYIVLEIASTPFRVTVNTGETLNIDVDKDGKYDMTIFLEKIVAGKAYLTMSNYVASGITTAPSAEPTTGAATAPSQETAVPGEEATTMQQGPDYTMTIVMLMVAAAVGIGIVVYSKSKK